MKNDYSRCVTLLCPVCGNSQFVTISEHLYRCSDCNAEFDKESLISQNTESTDAMVEDIKKEFVADVKKDLSKIFKGFR